MPSQQESSGDRASGSGVLSPSSNTFSSSVSTPCRVCYPPSSCGGVTSLSSSSRVSSEGKEKERREGSNVDPANDKTSLPLADEIKKKAESLDFQEIQHFSLKHLCIREWRCVHTQVRILVCRVESPICNLYMTFPTEAHTDEGLPHTLEHLVFLGSYQYPYKGVLDFLASRCLSQGTNAWTATDHTTYTLTTAGSEGLLNLLPVYLDHLLLPTLLPKAFKTEVHHLTDTAASAGVVYSEMESRERQASSVLYRRLIELLYPDGSGYRYETGGIMEQIRRTSNDRVREYHRHFYKWDNLSLIFTGVFDVPLLLHTVRSSITTIENIRKNASMNSSSSSPYPPSSPSPLDDLISKAVGVPEHADRPLNFSGPRPWSDPQNFALPSSSSSAVKFDRVYFPSDDEETGRVALGWRGPPWRELETREAVDILGSYLTEGNLAVLQRELVQCENPLCANVDFSSEGFKSTCFFIEGIDVKLEKKKKEKSLTNTATEKDQKERKEDDRQGEKGEDVDGGELDGKKDNETKQKKEEKERLEGSEKQDKGEGHAMKKQKRENENVLSEEKEEEEKGENASTEVDGDEERERGSEDGGEEEEATQLEDVGKAIRSLIETEAKKPLDLSRIHMLLRRELLQFYRALETNPHDTIAELLNEYIVNHSSPSDLQAFLDWGRVISSLTSHPESFWRSHLSTWFLKRPHNDSMKGNIAHANPPVSSSPSDIQPSSSSTSPKKVDTEERRTGAGENEDVGEREGLKTGEGVERSLPSASSSSSLHSSEGVGVVCYPSIALSTRYHEEDALREQTLREKIGEKALKELCDLVEKYKEEQKESLPSDILTSVPVAKIERVYLPKKCPLTNFDDPPSISSSACEEREEREKEGSHRKTGEMIENEKRREKEKNEDKRIEQNIQQETAKDVNMEDELQEKKENGKDSLHSSSLRKREEEEKKRDEEDRCRQKKEVISRALDKLSFPCQIDHNPSTEFISIKLLSRIPVESLTCEEKLSLILLSDLLFECDILLPNSVVSSSLFNLSSPSSTTEKNSQEKPSPKGYTRISYETLTRLLFEHATSSSSGFGLYSESGAASGSSSVLYHLFTLSITAPVDRYEQAVTLLLYVLCGVQIEPCRVSVHLKRHLKQLTSKKRSGKFLVQQIETGLRYKKSSYPNIGGWGRQIRFLKSMEKDLLSLTRYLQSAYIKLFSSGQDICLSLVVDISQLPLHWDTPWRDLHTKLSTERRTLLDFSSSSSLACKEEEDEQRVVKGKPGEKDRIKEGEKEEEKKKEEDQNQPAGCCHEKGEKEKKTEREVGEWNVPRQGRVKKFEEISKILRIKSAACDNLFSSFSHHRAGLHEEEEEVSTMKKKSHAVPCRLACGIGSSDAGHILVSVQAPAGYGREENADGIALLVMAECCSMMEGLLFRTVRGAGLAYGCDLAYYPWQGQLTLRLSPATDTAGAVKAVVSEFKAKVEAAVNGEARIFSDEEIVAGKCGTLFSIVSREETQSCQASQSLMWPLRGRSREENRLMLQAVANTTTEEVEQVARVYLQSIVTALTGSEEERKRVGGTVCIVTNKKKVEETVNQLQTAGVHVDLVPTEETLRSLQLADHEALSDLEEEEDEDEEEDGEGEEDDEDCDEDEGEEEDEEEEDDDDCRGDKHIH